MLWLPVGLLLGGALGNLADRAREGAVIDFIDPIAWPAFNLADAMIVVGRAGAAVRGRGPPRMSFRAEAAEAGMRLDAALAARGEAATRSEAQRLIDAGAVTVDGERRPKSHRLAEGELVERPRRADERRARCRRRAVHRRARGRAR